MERLGAGNWRARACTRTQWSQMHRNDTRPPKIHSWFVGSHGKSQHTRAPTQVHIIFIPISICPGQIALYTRSDHICPACILYMVCSRMHLHLYCESRPPHIKPVPAVHGKKSEQSVFPISFFPVVDTVPLALVFPSSTISVLSLFSSLCPIYLRRCFFSLISFSISPPSPPVCRLTACLPTWASAGRTSALTLKIPTWNASPWRSRRRSEWQCFDSLGLSKSLFFYFMFMLCSLI